MGLSPEYFPETPAADKVKAKEAIEKLSLFKNRFDPILSSFLEQEINDAREIRPELSELLTASSEFVLRGGKRLRPAFMFYAYKAAGGENEEAILRSTICVELVHTGALIHDDIIDNSDLRRSEPTMHRIFHSRLGEQQLGSSMAIVAGDTVLALAGKSLSTFPDSGERMKLARQYFDQMCIEISLGQYLDVLGNQTGNTDIDWVMKVMEFKTARYTVEKPLLIGGSLGGAKPDVLQALSNYAIPLGVVFQIQDDVLGMFGDERKVGKPVDSDLKEGKKTLLVLKTLERLVETGKREDIERFNQILGNPELTSGDYHWVQELMRGTGALTYSRELAEELISKAKSALGGVEISEEARDYLLGIADFMLEREY
ncbi:MAG: polyprenyl synthetase family protein [Microgenomates group bacterium]